MPQSLLPELKIFQKKLLNELNQSGAESYEFVFDRVTSEETVYEMHLLNNKSRHDDCKFQYRIRWQNESFSTGVCQNLQAEPKDLMKVWKSSATKVDKRDRDAFLVKANKAQPQKSIQQQERVEIPLENLQTKLLKKLGSQMDIAYLASQHETHTRQIFHSGGWEFEDQKSSWGVSGYLQSKAIKPTRSYSFSVSRPAHIQEKWEEKLHQWCQEATYQLSMDSTKQEKNALIILSPKAFLQLLSAFSNLFDGLAISNQESLIEKKQIGQKLFSSHLCVSDDPYHPETQQFKWDSEGVHRNPIPLIENGVLTHLLHSKLSAHRFETQSTGHGSLSLKPSSQPLFLRVCPSKKAPIKPLKTWLQEGGIYIHSLSAFHAGCQPLQGHFSLPLMGWHQTKTGIQSLPQSVLVGNLFDFLNQIEGFTKEVTAYGGGCSPGVVVKSLKIVQ
jgi:predicted Zn-dependent protease